MRSELARFDSLSHGTIYRTKSGLQGYYPRVVRLSERELLASFVAGTAVETPDSHPVLSRSTDGGVSWALQGPVDANRPPKFAPTETGFISQDFDGTLMCLGGRWLVDPESPDLPLVNPKTSGMRDNQIVLRRSSDGGRSWKPAEILPKPRPTPLELPTGMMALPDARNGLSCTTWPGWNGAGLYGHRVLFVTSADRCKTWGEPVPVFQDTSDRIGYWEARITPIPEGGLLATCWAHDQSSDKDLPNHFAVSRDGGKRWTAPMPTPVMGQTGWPLWLGGDRVLFVYNHRRSPVGVRAQIAQLDDTTWTTLYDAEIWSPQVQTESSISKHDYAVTSFQFGAPSAIRLDEGIIMVIYWCVTEGRAGINWSRIQLYL